VAATLKKIPGLDVQVANGAGGEFTILVDGQQVIRKDQELPSVEAAVNAVKAAALAKQNV
jgi:hypothetical protein